MTRFALPKIWLALVLLAASLSSSPMGSMEQGGGAMSVGHALDYHALPIARPLDLSCIGEFQPLLGDVEVPTCTGGAFAFAPAFPGAQPFGDGLIIDPPRGPDPSSRPSERLPYHPNAPPHLA